MGGEAAVTIHDMDLAMIAPRVGGNEDVDRGGGTLACAQQVETLNAEMAIDQRLGCNRAGTRSDVRDKCADGKKPCCNGDPEFPAVALTGDDRPGHSSVAR